MSCACRCHTYGPGSHASCDPKYDTGSSGVVGLLSCSPCDGNRPAEHVRRVVETGDGDCQVCGGPAQGTLCSKCTHKLTGLIGELPALLAELETTVSRQDRLDSSSTPVYGRRVDVAGLDAADRLHALIPPRLRSSQGRIALPATPWAYAPDGAAVLTEARAVLLGWARKVNQSVGGPRPTTPRSDLRSQDRAICTWLIGHRADIARSDLAGELFTSIKYQRNRIERAIDRTDPDVFLGLCDAAHVYCGADLYAHQGDKEVRCDICGWSYNVADRKESMLAKVYDEVRPVADVANAVTGLLIDERLEPVQCTPTMIHGFHARGRIMYLGTAPDGRSQLVRVGDVVDLLRERMDKAKARRPRRASA